jgi:DNA repair exonuclease SbcCD ATPase subunit
MPLIEDLRKLDEALMKKELEYSSVVEELVRKEAETKTTEDKHKVLVGQVTLDSEVVEVVKKLFETSSAEGIKFLEDLINQALQIVFTDEYYRFKIKFGSRGNEKTAEFILNNGVTESELSECGGGVQVLISFVFRIYYIMKSNLRRVVIMDESLSQLSANYIEPFMGFMKMLVDSYGFDFLWISHSPYVEMYCNKYYEVSKGRLYEKK